MGRGVGSSRAAGGPFVLHWIFTPPGPPPAPATCGETDSGTGGWEVCGGSESRPVATRCWVPFQHGDYLASAAKKHQGMAKCSGGFPQRSYSPAARRLVPRIWRGRRNACVGGAHLLPPAPKAPLTHRDTFSRRHLSDHMTWFPGHLFPEQTGEAVGRGRDGTRTHSAGAEPVHTLIQLSSEWRGPVLCEGRGHGVRASGLP